MAIDARALSDRPAAQKETSPAKRGIAFPLSFRPRVQSRELIYFTSQLSLMIEVGTSLTVAIKALATQTRNPHFATILKTMLGEIEGGNQLSTAMAQYPDVFDGTLVSMVHAGEVGGFLKGALDRLVEMQEKRQALANQLKTALTYPAALCVMAFTVIIFILVSVLPKFTTFFEGKEALLPPTTSFLMATSASMRSYWALYILAAGGAAVGFVLWKRSESGHKVLDWLAVTVPVVSKLHNKMCTCQLLRTLGHLLESQVPLIEALSVTRLTMRNRHFIGLVDQIRTQVEQGARLSQAFQSYPYTMESVRQMVSTGEESGNLYPVMLRLAKFYDAEVEQELKTFAALIEPLALIVLGSIVGVMVSAVILPMFKLAQAVH